jgi:hypothetical protein
MAEELLPDGMSMDKDTRELVVSCAQEFVHMLTFQANEIAQKETRNGYMRLDHVVRACEELGFADYRDEIEAVSSVYDQQLKTNQRVTSHGLRRTNVDRGRRRGLVGGVRGQARMSWPYCKLKCWRTPRRVSSSVLWTNVPLQTPPCKTHFFRDFGVGTGKALCISVYIWGEGILVLCFNRIPLLIQHTPCIAQGV